MAPLSKLTLTSYRRTQPNRGPVEERRSKTLTALEQQKLVLAAAQKGQCLAPNFSATNFGFL